MPETMRRREIVPIQPVRIMNRGKSANCTSDMTTSGSFSNASREETKVYKGLHISRSTALYPDPDLKR